jgi:ATP-binding cassette, subfamily C (CFTR/MRP), member 1
VVFLILGLIFYGIFQFYQKSNLSMKRLTAISASPLISHTSQTIHGLVLLKAFKKKEVSISMFYKFVDKAEAPSYIQESLSIWVNLRLGLLSSIVTCTILIISNIAVKSDSSSVGLGLVNGLYFAGAVYQLLLSTGTGEAELNAVERLYEYGNAIPKENPRILATDQCIPDWPKKGSIDIRNISIRYTNRPGQVVIKNLSLQIHPGEKVGICGRTGSGKSTLVTALFRLLELESGQILIDGQDISNIGLKTLRSRIQMIPQDPVLFNGSVRSNLDYEQMFDDDSFWSALESVGLKDFIQSLKAQLDAPIDDNGGNLSFGQKQLICIARAVLRNPKILIMDEASSGVDQETEETIQKLVMTRFPDTNILSIAHRLNTIAGFDKIAVLSDGNLLEMDSPKALLSKDSEFTRLVDDSGPTNAKLIKNIVFANNQSAC